MNVEGIKCYSLTDIARAKVKGQENALDQRGRNPMTAQHLLLFHPCNIDTSTEQLRELFSKKHSMDETSTWVPEIVNSEYEHLQQCTCPLCYSILNRFSLLQFAT